MQFEIVKVVNPNKKYTMGVHQGCRSGLNTPGCYFNLSPQESENHLQNPSGMHMSNRCITLSYQFITPKILERVSQIVTLNSCIKMWFLGSP